MGNSREIPAIAGASYRDLRGGRRLGRWSQYRRRARATPTGGMPRVVLATVDPGAFGPTDGVLMVTFDRPLTTCDAVDLITSLEAVGVFEYGNAPTFTPGLLVATWQSTSWTPGAPDSTALSWGGADGPIVFFDGSEMFDMENVPVTFI